MRDSVILSNQAPLEIPFQQKTGWVPGPKRNTCQTDLSQGNVRSTDVICHSLLNNVFPLPTVWPCLFHICLHLSHNYKKALDLKKKSPFSKLRRHERRAGHLRKCILYFIPLNPKAFCVLSKDTSGRKYFLYVLWLSLLSRGTTRTPLHPLLSYRVAGKRC